MLNQMVSPIKRNFLSVLAVSAMVFSLASCTDSSTNSNEAAELLTDSIPQIEGHGDGGLSGSVVKYKGEIFSIPSPIQTALLIRESEIPYNEFLLNPASSYQNYVNQFQKAMNMGVYGADLAYLSNFDNTAMSIEYFTIVERLADDLGIKNNINPTIISRFHASSEIRDSLYVLNAELYREVNQYLKDNERNEAASLILAGGWIEALHIALDVAQSNSDIRLRIGEQRSALTSLVALLSKYDDSQVNQVRKGLTDVLRIYDSMEYSYVFEEPITDEDEKTTYFNCKSSVDVTNDHVDQIKVKLSEIRTIIIS
jgi:hypothetical protein